MTNFFKLLALSIGAIIVLTGCVEDADPPKPVDSDDSSIASEVSQDASDKDDDKNDEGTNDDKSKDENAQTEFGIGEKVEYKDVHYTLVDVKEHTGSEYLNPSDGMVYLNCEFLIENESDEDVSVSSLLSFEAYADDYDVDQSFSAVIGDKGLDGTIAAGKKMQGSIGYEVSKDWKCIEIHFEPDLFGKTKIIFKADK